MPLTFCRQKQASHGVGLERDASGCRCKIGPCQMDEDGTALEARSRGRVLCEITTTTS